MSRKTKRNRTEPEPPVPQDRRVIVVGSVVVLLLVFLAATLLYRKETAQSSQPAGTASLAALASEHSPTLGDASAKVHIVEFLDPACETCALFFPLVKQLMAENPNRIRLSTRHVAFHEGSEYVVRMLEASRKQNRYWQTLEALLASQERWAPHHTVQPELALQVIADVELNVDQLVADMNAREVSQRMERDLNDAAALKVTATPEYFVNGRPLPAFGQQQLLDLVREELQTAY